MLLRMLLSFAVYQPEVGTAYAYRYAVLGGVAP